MPSVSVGTTAVIWVALMKLTIWASNTRVRSVDTQRTTGVAWKPVPVMVTTSSESTLSVGEPAYAELGVTTVTVGGIAAEMRNAHDSVSVIPSGLVTVTS